MNLKNIKELLLEKTRKELLLKQKRETPERVERANSYSLNSISIDSTALLSDWLVITTEISGNGSKYTDSIAFQFIMTDLIQQAKNDPKHLVNSKLIIKSIHNSLDTRDIYIDCSCQDFKYRYSYWSTKDKFKWGKLQNSNGKNIRNPRNDMGCMCKHLYALLRSNKFLNLISDKIMRTIMANLDVLVKKFNINILEFVVNSTAYDKMLRMNITRDKSGRFQKINNNEETSNQNDNESKVESIDEISIPKISQNDEKQNINKLLQYYTNETLLSILKDKTTLNDYIHFIKVSTKNINITTTSLEDYLKNNISCNKLLELINEYNSKLANDVVNELTIRIFK